MAQNFDVDCEAKLIHDPYDPGLIIPSNSNGLDYLKITADFRFFADMEMLGIYGDIYIPPEHSLNRQSGSGIPPLTRLDVEYDGCLSQPNRSIEICVEYNHFSSTDPSDVNFDLNDFNVTNSSLQLRHGYNFQGGPNSNNSVDYSIDGTEYIDNNNVKTVPDAAFYYNNILLHKLLEDYGLQDCGTEFQLKNCFFIPYYFNVHESNLAPTTQVYGLRIYDRDRDVTLFNLGRLPSAQFPANDNLLHTSISQSILDTKLPGSSSNIASDEVFVVTGNYLIDQDYSFVNSTLKFEAGSKIIVPSGRTLTLTACYLTSCNEDTWEGIEVENGGTLNFQSFSFDADKAIQGLPNSTVILGSGSRLRNFGSTGLLINSANILGQSNPEIVQQVEFSVNQNSKFQNFSGSPTGIRILKLPQANITFYNCGFQNLKNAAKITDADVVFDQSQFENISGDNLFTGGCIDVRNRGSINLIGFGKEASDPPTFINCPRLITGVQNGNIAINECKSEDARVGVETFFGGSFILQMANNSIIAAEEAVKHQFLRGGLHIFNNNDLIAKGNNLQATVNMSSNLSRPVIVMQNNYVKAGGSIGAGLKTNETSMAWYFENTFDASSSAFVGVDGSKVEQSGLTLFDCNSFIGKGQGGASQHGLDASSVNGTINCNVFTNNDHGFHSNASCNIDLASNTFANGEHGLYLSRETEISTQTHRGNVWNGSYSGTHGAFNANIDERIIGNSQFTVDNSTPDYLPDWNTGIDQNVDWFKTEINNGNEPGCPADCDPGSANRSEMYNLLDEKSDYYLQYMMPNTDGDILPGTYINMRQMLFEQLDVLDQRPADYEPFYQAYPATDEGQLYLAQESLDALYSADDYTLAQVDWGDAQQTALLFQQIADNTIAVDDPALTNIATAISSISGTSDQTTHVKDMLLLKIKLLQNPDYQISTQELAQIDVLANGCPMIDGYGVYMARSLARPLLDQEYDNETSCQNITDRQANRSEDALDAEQLQVAPNPAMQQASILLPDWEEGKTLQIMNAYGVLQQSITPQHGRIVLDISNWQAGIYYAHYGRHSARIVKVSE